MQKHLIVICGPTGVGKTSVAINVANALKSVIISCDSRQIYREMKIGTSVPGKKELEQVPHFFIHTRSIDEYYNASMFEQEVNIFLEQYFENSNTAIMEGGSGLYIDAVCKGIDELPAIDGKIREKWHNTYVNEGIDTLKEKLETIDPEYYNRVDKNNPKRLQKAIEVYEMTGEKYSSFLKNNNKYRPYNILKIGINTDRQKLYNQINERVDRMIEQGLIEEARSLYTKRHLSPLNTVGYKELFDYFDNKLSLPKAIEKIKDHSRAYARRQITWFRRDNSIKWFEPDQLQTILDYIKIQTGL
ncbi:MAG: tRNA (adenosine(37)-N6)-dimethylallyltransferase MiaA [Bacteroidales bacterium]|nr:tRNA (adenosine(37)-N6)-dimethylallyltransferase MiaA [Bacteroidales bacterium]